MNKEFNELSSSEKIVVAAYAAFWLLIALIGMGIIPF